MTKKDKSNDPPKEITAEEAALFPGLVDLVSNGGKRCFLMDDGRVEKILKQGAGEPNLIPPRGTGITWLLPDANVVAPVYDSLSKGNLTPLKLFQRVKKELEKHAALPTEDYYALLAAWSFATYRQDWFGYFPIIFLFGVAERGKNRIGDTLSYISYRGFATETANEAPLFWWADHLQPTLFVDVVNINKKASAKGSLDVLCGRFERGKKVIRVNPDKAGFGALRSHDVFGPTIIATNDLPEERLLSRGFLVVMPEAQRYMPPPRADNLVYTRSMLTAWRQWTMTEGQALTTNIPGLRSGRWRDVTQGLRQITTLVAPDELAAVDRALEHLYRERQGQKSRTADAELLQCVRTLLQGQSQIGWDDRIPSDSLLKAFQERMGWERVTSTHVGNRMRGLGFEQVKVDRGARRGWLCPDTQLKDLEHKYGLDEKEETPDEQEQG
ncbi:hypothetical protein LCGC14_2018130 [marine sediment metagenome]|uniref:DUF3631 domain-containing protein n=1 Tax=marine sediment metagenome TaxID=412755 RepID=A0A0F9FKU3_9ZZZZ